LEVAGISSVQNFLAVLQVAGFVKEQLNVATCNVAVMPPVEEIFSFLVASSLSGVHQFVLANLY
jgi:hypothetical protein